MNIRIGDIVRFISDKLEGKVTGIIDNNTVNVYCDEYGFEIPASVNNLVVIHSDSNTTKMVSATSASGRYPLHRVRPRKFQQPDRKSVRYLFRERYHSNQSLFHLVS